MGSVQVSSQTILAIIPTPFVLKKTDCVDSESLKSVNVGKDKY